MATPEQNKALADIQVATLNRVLDQIKFAEAKNAALLTFASAWTLALLNLLSGDKPLIYGMATAGRIAIALLALAGIFALWSFLPRSLDFFFPHPERAKNLLFYGDVALFETSEFGRRVRERYMPADGTVTSDAFLDDLFVQVSVTSRIAERKFRLFFWGAAAVMAAVPVVLAPLAIPIVDTSLRGALALIASLAR